MSRLVGELLPGGPGSGGVCRGVEIIMTPTFFADGGFMGSDHLTFFTPRTAGHGSWIHTGNKKGNKAMEGGAAAAPDFVKPEDHVLQHLAGIDLTPDDIEIVICTHFDPDHAGANELFTSAELIVQRRHDEFVRSTPVDRFEDYRPSWDYPGLRYRLVDGDTVIAPGVEVIDTSGHVPGHQSVLVRLPESGPVLLAIDALHHDPATPYEPGAFDMSPTDTAASIEKLKALIEREGVTLTVFGHDGEQWATLRHAPEYYA